MTRFLAALPWVLAGDVCHAIGYAICGRTFITDPIPPGYAEYLAERADRETETEETP